MQKLLKNVETLLLLANLDKKEKKLSTVRFNKKNTTKKVAINKKKTLNFRFYMIASLTS